MFFSPINGVCQQPIQKNVQALKHYVWFSVLWIAILSYLSFNILQLVISCNFFSSTVQPGLNSHSLDWQSNLSRQVELQVKWSDNSARKNTTLWNIKSYLFDVCQLILLLAKHLNTETHLYFHANKGTQNASTKLKYNLCQKDYLLRYSQPWWCDVAGQTVMTKLQNIKSNILCSLFHTNLIPILIEYKFLHL